MSAENMDLKTTRVDMTNSELAQQSPCAFGTFCIIKDGEILSHHPISNTRFENLMKKQNEKWPKP